jgi:hypothetical protein
MVVHERSRDVKLLGWLDALFKDLRFGLRMLRKDLVVASAAVLFEAPYGNNNRRFCRGDNSFNSKDESKARH